MFWVWKVVERGCCNCTATFDWLAQCRMDRWQDADDDVHARPKAQAHGRVAAQGLGGFVRAAGDGAGTSAVSKIEVVPSKKVQVKQKQDAASMPPPPPRVAAPLASSQAAVSGPGPGQGQHGIKPPAWASPPPPGACLEVLKGEEHVQDIPLIQVGWAIGTGENSPQGAP